MNQMIAKTPSCQMSSLPPSVIDMSKLWMLTCLPSTVQGLHDMADAVRAVLELLNKARHVKPRVEKRAKPGNTLYSSYHDKASTCCWQCIQTRHLSSSSCALLFLDAFCVYLMMRCVSISQSVSRDHLDTLCPHLPYALFIAMLTKISI